MGFTKATGYVTTAEKKVDWEILKKQLPPGTPKPNDSLLAPGSLVFFQPKKNKKRKERRGRKKKKQRTNFTVFFPSTLVVARVRIHPRRTQIRGRKTRGRRIARCIRFKNGIPLPLFSVDSNNRERTRIASLRRRRRRRRLSCHRCRRHHVLRDDERKHA